jgi:hypothetical protein
MYTYLHIIKCYNHKNIIKTFRIDLSLRDRSDLKVNMIIFSGIIRALLGVGTCISKTITDKHYASTDFFIENFMLYKKGLVHFSRI